MKICNAQGCGVCYICDGTPPITNGYSHGDICRKKAESIINALEDGELYRFKNGKLYQIEVSPEDILEETEYTLEKS